LKLLSQRRVASWNGKKRKKGGKKVRKGRDAYEEKRGSDRCAIIFITSTLTFLLDSQAIRRAVEKEGKGEGKKKGKKRKEVGEKKKKKSA